MAKKLTVEVDAETSKAKRKIQELAETGVAGGESAAGAAAEKTAKSLNKLEQSAGGLDKRMLGVTRAFAGMAAGMAASYAARYFAEGSSARTAMDYGGAALSGAGAGAMAGTAFGPAGALIGAGVGAAASAGKTYLDKSAEQAEKLADFEKSEKIYESVKAWQDKLLELTETMNRSEIERILSNLKETEQTFKTRTTEAIEGGRYGEAADYQRNLGDVRNRQGQLEALLRNLDKATKPRESFAALDSLSRIGASFGGGDLGRDQLNVQREMAQTLRSIDQKTKTGGSTWQ